MSGYLKKTARRGLAASLAAVLAAGAAFTGAGGSAFDFNNIKAYAASADTVYDAGVIKFDEDGTEASDWDVKDISSNVDYKVGEVKYSLPSTLETKNGTLSTWLSGAGKNAFDVTCLSTWLGEGTNWEAYDDSLEDSTEAELSVTDYQIAPADRNLDYYYIAKGSITEEAVGKIEWELMCWPKNQHDAGLPLDLTQAGLEKEWSNAQADLRTEVQGRIDAKDTSRFDSQFGLARPRWESGNIKYYDWYDDEAVAKAEAERDKDTSTESITVSATSTFNAGISFGHSLTTWGGSFPWVQIIPKADNADETTKKEANRWFDLYFTNPILKYGSTSDYAPTVYKDAETSLAVRGLGSSKARDQENNVSGSEYDMNQTDYSGQKYVLSKDASYLFAGLAAGHGASADGAVDDEPAYYAYTKTIYDLFMNKAETAATMLPTSSMPLGESYKAVSMDAKGAIELGWTKDGGIKPTSQRVYALWLQAVRSNGKTNDIQWTHLYSPSRLNKSEVQTNLDSKIQELDKDSTINVTPIYDISYDRQRGIAANKVEGKINYPSSPAIVSTVAVDATTGTHYGELSDDPKIKETVKYVGLEENKPYYVLSKAFLLNDGGNIQGTVADGAYFTGTANFTTSGMAGGKAGGTVDVNLTKTSLAKDKSAIIGHKFVVYTWLYDETNKDYAAVGKHDPNKAAAKHDDPKDANEQVTYPDGIDPKLSTTASDGSTGAVKGSKEIGCMSNAVIKDEVHYEGLAPLDKYTLTTSVYSKTEGAIVNATASKPVVTTITPKFSSGDVTVTVNMNTLEFSGQEFVIYEELKDEDGNVICEHNDPDDAAQTFSVIVPAITTKATDADTGDDQMLSLKSDAKILDTVSYENLQKGTSYSLTATVYDKSTAKPVADIKAVSATFTASGASGETTVEIPVDATKFLGKSLVVYEVLKAGSVVIASHEDLRDDEQTLKIEGPSITTKASGEAFGDHTLPVAKSTVIVDRVSYEDLEVGREYSLTASVYDVAKDEVSSTIKSVTKTFTPTKSDGEEIMKITADTTKLAGQSFVVFEELVMNKNVIAEHSNPTDEDQTVTVISPTLDTIARDEETGSTSVVQLKQDAIIVDEVYYENLQPDQQYTLTTTVYDRSTGKAFKDLKAVSTNFTPSMSSDKYEVSIPIDATKYLGKTLVIGEVLSISGTTIAEHVDMGDADQTLKITGPGMSTVATGEASGTHALPVADSAVIFDRVNYEGLLPGQSYTLTAKLYDCAVNDFSEQVGEISKTFKPSNSDGQETMKITINTQELLGRSFVVYEYLYLGNQLIVEHADVSDANQTVTVTAPSISTKAVDSESKTHVMMYSKVDDPSTFGNAGVNTSMIASTGTQMTANEMAKAAATGKIVDSVSYTGLQPKQSYTLVAKVYDQTTGDQITGIPEVTKQFNAEGWSGAVDVEISVDKEAYKGRMLVVYEYLYGQRSSEDTKPLAKHDNINDSNQMVYVGFIETDLMTTDPASPKTTGLAGGTIVNDVITYGGLEPGVTYTVIGVLVNYDAVTGEQGVPSDSSERHGTPVRVSKSEGDSALNSAYKRAVEARDSSASADNDDTNSSSSDSSSSSSGSNRPSWLKTPSSTASSSSNSSSSTSSSSSSSDTTTGSIGMDDTDVSSSETLSADDSSGDTSSAEASTVSSGSSRSSAPKVPVYGSNMAEVLATATIQFTPTATVGVIPVQFVVDTTDLNGHKMVAYETIYKGSDELVSHKDIHDDRQTVIAGGQSYAPAKTGVESHKGLFAGIFAAAAVLAVTGVVILTRRKRED